jgi:hypothetical protein
MAAILTGSPELFLLFFDSYKMVRSEGVVAFVAISMGYRDPLQHKVHFEPKSAFEEMPL